MKESDLDTETIAALLAGRLGEPERAAALERLATSGDDFGLFIETAAVLRQIEEEEQGAEGAEADAGVTEVERASSPAAAPPQGTEVSPPPSVARPRWRRRRGAVAIASVVAIALAVLVLLVLPREPTPRDPLSAPAALLSQPRVPSELIHNRPWSPVLGTQAVLAPPARAARLGALHTDFEVALRARDSSTVAAVMAQIRSLLAQLPAGGDEVVRGYGAAEVAATEEPERSAVLLRHAGELAASRLERERGWMEAGAWAEAGRIAVAGRDAAFFAAPATRAALQRARELPLSDQGKDALERARAEIRSGREPRWSVLGPALDELLAALGG